jgi:hypothetical protein
MRRRSYRQVCLETAEQLEAPGICTSRKDSSEPTIPPVLRAIRPVAGGSADPSRAPDPPSERVCRRVSYPVLRQEPSTSSPPALSNEDCPV